jgi:hypothetical protein
MGVERPELEDYHSSPSNAEVKNAWSYTSIPQYAFMAWCLVKAQGPCVCRRSIKHGNTLI